MYAASELLGIAIRIEENGERFYKLAAAAIADQEARTVLFFLADQEAEHGETFGTMLEDVSIYAPIEDYPGEQAAYLASVADQAVFVFNPAELAGMDTPSTLRFALKRESDSILFYTELKAILPFKHHQLLDRIIGQEKEHFTRLSGLLKGISTG